MVVAAGAADGHAEEDGAGGVGAVLIVHGLHFVGDDAAFVRGDVAALEAAGDLLLHGAVGEQVAGHLPEDELIEAEVFVEGLDDPVAIGPHFAVVIDVEAVGIGVAGGVEPEAGAVFAVLGGGEVAVDELFVGVGGGVGEEGFDVGGLGRETGEIEGEAAGEGAAVGFGSRGETGGFDAGEQELVEGAAGPAGVADGGQRRLGGLLEGPVLLPGGALGDPAGEDLLLLGGDFFVGLRRGHEARGVRVGDALEDEAGGGLAGDDGSALFARGEGAFAGIEAEVGHAGGAVRAVTVEAVIGKNRAHLALEVYWCFGQGESRGERDENDTPHSSPILLQRILVHERGADLRVEAGGGVEVEDAAAVFAGHQYGVGAELLPELQADLHEAALALGVDGFDGDDAVFMLLAEAFVEAGELGRQRGQGGLSLLAEGGYFGQTGLVTGEGLLAGGLEVFLHGEQRLFGRAEFRAELLFFHQQFELALFGLRDGLFGPVDFVFEGAGLG